MSRRAREIRIAAHAEHPYQADEWRDSLVIVGDGVLELESLNGVRRRFGAGSVLYLRALRLRTLRNPGDRPAVLSAFSRAR